MKIDPGLIPTRLLELILRETSQDPASSGFSWEEIFETALAVYKEMKARARFMEYANSPDAFAGMIERYDPVALHCVRINKDKKLQAIKDVRELWGCGLKDAKEVVEELVRRHPEW